MIRLRGHHLLCLLTYQGLGYNAAFVKNLDDITARLASGEWVQIEEGPDDICHPLLSDTSSKKAAPHCVLDRITQRDHLAYASISRWLDCPIQAGSQLQLDPEQVQHLRTGFAKGTLRAACTQCEWHSLCTTIAHQENYQYTRLHPPSK